MIPVRNGSVEGTVGERTTTSLSVHVFYAENERIICRRGGTVLFRVCGAWSRYSKWRRNEHSE